MTESITSIKTFGISITFIQTFLQYYVYSSIHHPDILLLVAMETFSLHWADFLILAIALAVSLMIGVVLWRRSLGRQTNEDYVLGGRRAPLAPVVISLIVTYVSAVTMLGSSAEFYVHGAQVVFFFVGQALGVIIAAATTVPLLYDLKLTSADQVGSHSDQRKLSELFLLFKFDLLLFAIFRCIFVQ